MTSARDELRRQALAERKRLVDACRDILASPDCSGRRWLIGHLDAAPVGQPPQDIAVPCRAYLDAQLQGIREQLISEFTPLFPKKEDLR